MKSAKKLGIALATTLVVILVAELGAAVVFPAPTGYFIFPPGLDHTPLAHGNPFDSRQFAD